MKASEIGPKLKLYLEEQEYRRHWNSCGADHPLMCESKKKMKSEDEPDLVDLLTAMSKNIESLATSQGEIIILLRSLMLRLEEK